MKQNAFIQLCKLTVMAIGLTSNLTISAEKPKNIIFMIGDGMGVAHTTSYRYFTSEPNTTVKPTVFDSLLVGTASTYPADNTFVTDSAASATALSSGIKSYNGAIGVDVNKQPVLTLLEKAKQLGKTTAIVASSQINHATPASFMTHNESRKNYNEIADAYFDERINGKPKADLMLGGGTAFFERDDRNLVAEFKEAGYQYINDLNQLSSIKKLPVLGLFAPVGLPFAVDNHSEPNRVTAMTKTALKLLSEQSSEQGFFVMIEGSQIDWCSHANDVACTMAEMNDFANAIQLAKDFTEKHGDTLLVITADHSTGGLSIGADGTYAWNIEKVKQINASFDVIMPTFAALDENISKSELLAVWKKYIGFDISETQLVDLKSSLSSSLKKAKVAKTIRTIINKETLTGWTTSGHSAGDVQVFAAGVNSHLFSGHQDNTDIAKKLFLQLNSTK